MARADEYPVVNRVCDEHGFVTFALAYDLINAHSEGDVTIRQIAGLADLSDGTAYDLVEALYQIQELGDTNPSPTTYTPDDVASDNLPSDLTNQ